MSDIAVDTSAIVEVMIEGPRAQAVESALDASALAFVTSAARVEAAIVMMGRFGWSRAQCGHAWEALAMEELPVDSVVSSVAIDAFECGAKVGVRQPG